MQIYVLPSEEGLPPRAIVGEAFIPGEDGILVLGGGMITWTADSGTWVTEGGMPVPEELADATTSHARDLGVEQFLSD